MSNDYKKLQWQLDWVDHGILRRKFWNLHEISPRVWRSNQPCPDRLRVMNDCGIRSVLSLRGGAAASYNILEEEACERLGLIFARQPFTSATRAPYKEALHETLTALRALPEPIVFHCKSGADRTGVLAALYLALIEKVPPEQAAKELRHGRHHLRIGKAGVLSQIFRGYQEQAAPKGIAFGDWYSNTYDLGQIEAEFRSWRRRIFGLIPSSRKDS